MLNQCLALFWALRQIGLMIPNIEIKQPYVV